LRYPLLICAVGPDACEHGEHLPILSGENATLSSENATRIGESLRRPKDRTAAASLFKPCRCVTVRPSTHIAVGTH